LVNTPKRDCSKEEVLLSLLNTLSRPLLCGGAKVAITVNGKQDMSISSLLMFAEESAEQWQW